MANQTWINYVPDPKVVAESSPGISSRWGYGFEATGGGAFGDAAAIVTSGGPLAEAPHYATGSSGGTSVERATVGYGQGANSVPASASFNKLITVSLWGWINVPATARLLISGFSPGGTFYGEIAVGEAIPISANTWEMRAASFILPDGWDRITVYIDFIPNTPASGITVRGSAAMFVPPSDLGTDYSGPYFDGDLTDIPDVATYSWIMSPNASPSYAVMAVAPPSVSAAQISAQVVPIPNPVIPRILKPLYLKDFSVQEDSTPIYASDSTGGAGTMTLQVDENGDTPYLLDAQIDLVDPAQGTTRGTIRGISSDDTAATLNADSRMALLNVKRNAAAVVGTLEDALTYYYGLCGINDGFVIDESIQDDPVTFLGFSGNVWEFLKRAGAVNGFELTLVSNNIVARPVRQNVSENYRDSSRSWSYDTSQQALSVEVYKYTVSEVTSNLIYNGYAENQTPLSIDAGTSEEFTIPFSGSIISLDQPVYTTTIGPGDPGFSAYNAIGNDNLPITAAQWANQGGSLSIRASDDSRSIIVTVTAPSETQYSPYRIGVSDGETTYSTLRIHGDALLYTKEMKTFHTAVDPDRVSQEVGATIDSEFVQTDQQLLDVAMGELRYWGGNRRTINVGTRGINRLGDSGSYAYATFEDFDSWWDDANPGADFGDFDTDAPPIFGSTFGEHDDWWIAEVQDDFANQAFGNIAGARVYTDSNVHRIRTATTTPEGVTYAAWEDSLFGDHDTLWDEENPSATFASFDAHWIGRAFVEFDATPLEAVS